MPDRLSDQSLLAAIRKLGPWHHKILLRDDIWTGNDGADPSEELPGVVEPARSFTGQIGKAFPNGLEGRSFLDCACNAGGYSFAARDAGAGTIFGFDVRQRWIEQALFVARNRERDSSNIEFRVGDVFDLSPMCSFDVTWFSGIFYHLPDPVCVL